MRRAVLSLLAAGAVAAACVPLFAVAKPARAHTFVYRGTTRSHGYVSFHLSRGRVTAFRFVNRCPADSNAGTLVPATMRVRRGRFSYHDAQFTVHGRLLRRNRAMGTARDVTGDCDSGVVHWSARRR